MKNKKKAKEIEKSRRKHPIKEEASKDIDSSKGGSGDKAKTATKLEQANKKGKAVQKTTKADAKAMDQTTVSVQRNGHHNTSNVVHNKQTTDSSLALVTVAKNDCIKDEKDPTREKLDEDILPIHVTAAMNDVNQMRRMFERDPATGRSRCDPNVHCLSDGSTALLMAIRSKQTDAAKILLENGADVTLTDNTGDNALLAAIKSSDANVVNAIWPYRGQLDVDHANYAGWSALHLATERKWECCITFLLQNRANSNIQSLDGVTPLMLAATNGDTKSAENLIKSGADILMEDYDGNTSICKAFAKGQHEMVQYLLKKLPNDRKDVFIRSRLDLIVYQEFREDEKKQIETSYLPILHLCTEDTAFRGGFYNSKAMQKIIQTLQENSQNFEIAILASHLIFCIMFRFCQEFDIKFVKQFIRYGGPDLVIYLTKLYTEQWKIPEREIVSVFLPMISLSELNEGRLWLKKNWVSVSEYLNFFGKNSLKFCLSSYCDNHWCPNCTYVDKIVVVWQRFHDVMNNIQTEEREKHMNELLEEEEREKERQAKKKEKKKQKKQDKQSNAEDFIEEDACDGIIEESLVCENSDTIKNENSNAGPENSKIPRRQKKITDVAQTIFQLPTRENVKSNTDNCQSAVGFQEFIQADFYSKSEQWTTIPTKRQIQKEKEKKQTKKQTESMAPDFKGKNNKTPRKSPKKKNMKGDPNTTGPSFPAAPISSGSTRWADIAKGMVKTTPSCEPVKQTPRSKIHVLQRPDKQFGEQDFPSLNDHIQEPTTPEKNCLKPAKLTFHFHEPILPQKPTDLPKEPIAPDNFGIQFGSDLDFNAIRMSAEDHMRRTYGDTSDSRDKYQYEDGWEDKTEADKEKIVEAWVETEMVSVWDDNTGSTDGDQQPNALNHQNQDIKKDHCAEVEDHDFAEEDWSDVIKEIDDACDDNYTTIHYSNTPTESHGMNTPGEFDQSDMTVYQNEPNTCAQDNTTIKETNSTDYVGPENCQVEINTIIQHQIAAFPFFEVCVGNRNNDPFFDPSVPLPKELRFGEDVQDNTVDALFEDSEEIPSWFMDTEAESQEDTWNAIHTSSDEYVKPAAPCYDDDFSSIDPAIIGYKNMNNQQVLPQSATSVAYATKENLKSVLQSPQPVGLLQDSVDPCQVNYENQYSYSEESEQCSQAFDQDIDNEKQTAVIKPLQSKSKNTIPVVNSAFGQTLLENACRLERTQLDDSIAYPDELDGEPFPDTNTAYDMNEADDNDSSDSTFHFPSFHADTKLSGHLDKRDVSVLHQMQRLQQEQLARYYKQHRYSITMEPASPHHDSFAYHASCAGMNRQDIDDCLTGKVREMSVKGPTLDASKKENKTFKDITKPLPQMSQAAAENKATSDDMGYYNMMQTNGQPQMAAQSYNRQVSHFAVPNVFPINQYLPPPMHPANFQMIQATQAAMAQSVMNQIKEVYKTMMKSKMKSVRWKEELGQLRNLPTERQMVVGKIVIPREDRDRICIARSSSGPIVLGFLADGTEVAVKVIDWAERDFTLDELQRLVNMDVSKYFMNKYKAFCSQDGYYYMAMSLYEYSLPEYLAKLHQDEAIDEVISCSKLVWQLMRGLASLHQHCLMVHGELRPENIAIDTDGNVRISGYGLGKNTNRDTPFVEYCDDDKCWLAPEVLVHKQKVSFKSDIFVAGMLTYYILSGGKSAFGSEPEEIVENIAEGAFAADGVTEEACHLLSLMLSPNKSERPCISDALRHPYFWADEKRLRFILIAGSDVLRDLKAGVPMDGSIRDSMIGIIGTTPCNIRIINWIGDIEPVVMREMRVFRTYKNNVVELVLFIYNCCLHFDKMSDNAREVIDEPCKYFLNKFPTLFMTVYRAIKNSSRTERTCYKPFF